MKPDIKWLDDPEVFCVNRLPAHSDHCFYPDRESWREGRKPFHQLLNGRWQFCWSRNAKERPAEFYREDYDASGFSDIPVPGHMELSGYDRIHYVNTMYPWEGHLYRRPAFGMEGTGEQKGQFSEAEYNPVGSYRREFDLEQGLLGKRVCISFEGVEQAFYVWLNGEFVGYGEDSFTPSDFDLTPFIREKGNLLAVEVHKRSTAAYLEDQDFFRFSGIFRNVVLYAKPEVHLEDMWAKPELCPDGVSGRFSLELWLSGDKRREEECFLGCQIRCLLSGPDGRTVVDQTITAAKKVFLNDVKIGDVAVWEHRNPKLYQLEVTLLSREGEVLEVAPYQVGFRRIEIKDKLILLNGKRLIINGVNRHEWSAAGGRVISEEEMRWDMDCLHENHINSVRTCHYPNQIPWYYMCDREGIYLMAEANLESHGSWQKRGAVEPSWNVPGSVPQWREAVLDRGKSNFETFKNHPSVLFWSLGNESYAGTDIEDMQVFLKERDPGRLVHYEGVFHNRQYEDTISDVESQMYAPPERIKEYLENDPKKPFILCEYMHDMGNSLGGMKSYMELLDRYEMYQGGYIWDFIDQALYWKDEETGEMVLRYGGDFDDRPSDYEFSGDGIVFADRTTKPAMQEVRYYYGRYE